MAVIGIKICRDLLNDMTAHQMPPDEFVRQFEAALRGEEVYLSKFVKPWNGRMDGGRWAIVRSAVFKRDNFTCGYCGDRGGRLECDHVVPLSKGGSDDMENLKTACFSCNRSKYNKKLGEWNGPH